MPDTGPPIEQLTRRLAETPEDFLSPLVADADPVVNVAAVVSDLLEELGGQPLGAADAKQFRRTGKGDTNRITLVLVASWLLHDSWFRARGGLADPARVFLLSGINELATVVAPDKFVSDPDRREELVRNALSALDLIPLGESEVVARDRLMTLSTIERNRVLKESAEAQARIRALQEAMRQKAAQEASPAWGHE